MQLILSNYPSKSFRKAVLTAIKYFKTNCNNRSFFGGQRVDPTFETRSLAERDHANVIFVAVFLDFTDLERVFWRDHDVGGP